jgi:hypothetical protein
METIKIHSLTDLITNSSTVIYTYSDRSPKALKEMIDEIFKVLGVEQKCKDVFDISVGAENDQLFDFIMDCDEDFLPKEIIENDYSEAHKWLNKIFLDIESGAIKKPAWIKKAEKSFEEQDCDGFPPDTTMCVKAKDPKYEKLADLVVKFLYSTDHEGSRDG